METILQEEEEKTPSQTMSNQNSATNRIILAINSRLLREMLFHSLLNQEGIKIVGQTTDLNQLPKLQKQNSADWIITSLTDDGEIPQRVKEVFKTHPNLWVLAISMDGRQIKSRFLESHKVKIRDISPYELKEALTTIQGHLDDQGISTR